MTPSQYIEAMKAGWNLGSCYDGSWYDIVNTKYRYWCCNGTWQYKVNSGGYKNISVFKEAYVKGDHLLTFAFTFTPTEDNVSITLKHPFISETTETLPLIITSAKIAGTTKTTLTNSLVFPTFSSHESTLVLDLTTIFSESALDKEVTLNVKIDSSNLVVKPTTNETVLSAIRTMLITRVITMAGFQDVRQPIIKAVKAIGFNSIRIPIQWVGRFDELDDEGHVHVDTEFLDHLAVVLGWCHDEGMMVCINMHHDDNDRDMNAWLTTTKYLNDPATSVRYKDIWRQVAEYFKDYGDWLAFASNNETLNDSQHWENPSATDVYGIKKMQEDFYNTVRSVAGNENRICIYPTYAAKPSCLNSTWTNPSDSSDTGKWDIPYDDAYGIVEIHPYAASSLSNMYTMTNQAKAKHRPVIYGEFGNGDWTEKTPCYITAYQVGYATYFGFGTFIWDDGGGMKILERNAVTANNYTSKELWAGHSNDFIPSLTGSANLREAEILLNNRRQSCYMGDTVEIYLDTDKHVYISNEGSGNVDITNGNVVKVGHSDINDLLAISYDGEYNTIDITVKEPTHWISETFNEESNWESGGYSIYPQDGVQKTSRSYVNSGYPALRYKDLIEVNGTAVRLNWVNGVNARPLYVVEYNANRQMVSNASNYGVVNHNGVYYPKAAAKYLGVFVDGYSQPTYDVKRSLAMEGRDSSQIEEDDRTDNFTASIVNYNNYDVSVYRTIDVAGGVDYLINMGTVDCKVYVREFNGDKIEAEGWYENGDVIHTNLFTKTMRLEIEVPNNKIADIIDNFNDQLLFPVLEYTDFYDRPSEYNEEYTPIEPIEPTELEHGLVKIDGKFLKYNGKFVKV